MKLHKGFLLDGRKERSRIRTIQKGSFRGLLDMRVIEYQMCSLVLRMDEVTHKYILWWNGYVKGIEY